MSATQVYDPSTAYAAGRWIVSYSGLKFGIARKGDSDSSEFTTLGDAMAAADARNGGLS
jgi:hypothetical protein